MFVVLIIQPEAFELFEKNSDVRIINQHKAKYQSK